MKRGVFVLLCCFYCCVSCVDSRKAVYFNNQRDSILPASAPIPESIIQNNDLLSISVSSLNAGASSVFNSANFSYTNNANGNDYSDPKVAGYLVDKEGFIQFPVLGNVKAAGLTQSQLKRLVIKQLTDKKLLVDPIISIRYLNYKITVLGEVAKPMVINVPSEKITLFEALGLAGDITIYGKKDNVTVIREEAGKRVIKRLNLNSGEIFGSPYYYLLSNDVVYVEPTKARVASSGKGSQLLPVIFGGLSFAVIVLDRLIK